MITGDLIKHKQEDDSFGVVMSIDTTDVKVLWLDEDYPAIEYYLMAELLVTSSVDLDWENDVIMFKA